MAAAQVQGGVIILDDLSDEDSGREVAGNTETATPSSERKSCNWTWTWNNCRHDPDELMDIIKRKLKVTYVIFQKEKVTTEHYQGYLHVKNPIGLKTITKVMFGAHLEFSKGTPLENKEYCTKSKSRIAGPWEYGELPVQGKRNDIKEFVEKVKAGKIVTFVDSVEQEPNLTCRYLKFAERMLGLYKKRMHQTEGVVFWGAAGKGKSKKAWETWPDAYSKGDGKWFDGYQGEETIIWDDFDDAQVPLGAWLKLVDRYPLQVEVKGGYVPMMAKRIVFTSNIHPDMWFPAATMEQREAIKRRLVSVEEFKS